MLRTDPRLPRRLRLAWRALCVVAGLYLALTCARLAGIPLLPVDAHLALQFLLLVGATGVVLARALALRDARATWLLLTAGLAL